MLDAEAGLFCEPAGRPVNAHVSDGALLARVLIGFALSFVLGFERELRGSSAGDRTFALVGAASACIAAVTATTPQALAGIITGVGFIGGGVILRTSEDNIRGVTTAAAIFAAAAVGLVVGTGHLVLGTVVAALVLFVLELRFLPGLRRLDARRYTARFRPDASPPA